MDRRSEEDPNTGGTGYGWLDDAFDDEKAAQELERAQRSRNLGCLIVLLAAVLIIIAFVLFSCGAIAMIAPGV